MGKARYPVESRLLILLDSGFRRNDEMGIIRDAHNLKRLL